MTDQLIDAAMARGLHADACRVHALVGWVVRQSPPEYPGKFVARLVTGAPPTCSSPTPWPRSTPSCRRIWCAPGASRPTRPRVVESWFPA